MYDMNRPYEVTSTLNGKHVGTQVFSAKKEAMAWFKKASTDPEWFGAGWRIVLRHHGRILKEAMA